MSFMMTAKRWTGGNASSAERGAASGVGVVMMSFPYPRDRGPAFLSRRRFALIYINVDALKPTRGRIQIRVATAPPRADQAHRCCPPLPGTYPSERPRGHLGTLGTPGLTLRQRQVLQPIPTAHRASNPP